MPFRLAVGVVCVALGPAALAEPPRPPDAGAIMRNEPRPLIPAPSAQPPLEIPKPTAPAADQGVTVTPKAWKFTGATLIPEAELQERLQAYLSRELSLKELWQAAQSVATLYRERGYLARATLPKQEIRGGVVEIKIIEARLGDVAVEGDPDVISPERAKETVFAAQPQGQTLLMQDLERGVLLLNDLPGVSASPYLKPGKQPGETDLGLKIESHPRVSGSLDYANAGVNAVGEHQFGGSLFVNNALGIGDQATFRVQGGSGNVYGRLTYSLPVGYSGLRVGIAGSGMYYTLGDVPGTRFKVWDADGDAWIGGIFASYPILRSGKANFYTIAGFDTRRYHNVSKQEALNSDKTLNVGYVGLQGDYRDDWLGGGFNNYSFFLTAGDVDLTGNAGYLRQDQSGPRTQGAYQKFSLNLSRLQKLPGPFSFWLNFAGQMSTKDLDSSEKFSLGGPYGVRAYPVNEALADEGYLLNFELRYDAYQDPQWGNVQLVGFIDHGGVRLHNNLWLGSGPGPNEYTLSGGGVGVNWIVPGNFAVKLSVAQRIGDNPARSVNNTDSDGTRDTPHFWAQLSKFF